MVPVSKAELTQMVRETAADIYEELTPQLITILDQTKHNEQLTDPQKNDEVMLHMMGYVKSCTNEIMIDVLAQILGLEE